MIIRHQAKTTLPATTFTAGQRTCNGRGNEWHVASRGRNTLRKYFLVLLIIADRPYDFHTHETESIYVLTHDSIGLGEDGPTHQPVEHLSALRSMQTANVYRPADAMETLECWEMHSDQSNAVYHCPLTSKLAVSPS